jgi:hypothetical protein
MNDIILVNLPINTMEAERLRHAGFPVAFTVEECSMILKARSANDIRLSNNPDYPVIYYNNLDGILGVLPVYVKDGVLCSKDPKIRRKGFDMWEDFEYPLVMLKDNNDWIGIYKQMPEEFRIQVFMENFHRIPMDVVHDVFDFVFNDITIDDLPEPISNYIKSAADDANEIIDTVVRKLRSIKEMCDSGEDIFMGSLDRDCLKEYETGWLENLGEQEIEIEK